MPAEITTVPVQETQETDGSSVYREESDVRKAKRREALENKKTQNRQNIIFQNMRILDRTIPQVRRQQQGQKNLMLFVREIRYIRLVLHVMEVQMQLKKYAV